MWYEAWKENKGGKMSPEEKQRFEKDALLHKLQDERESILYKFIDYYTQDELIELIGTTE